MERERRNSKYSWPVVKYCSWFCPVGLRKTIMNLRIASLLVEIRMTDLFIYLFIYLFNLFIYSFIQS